jgi:hypothetical protein
MEHPIGSLGRFRRASEQYRPEVIRLLFIAEAPPAFKANRLFYFANLTEGDTLFLEMMKVLYPSNTGFDRRSFLSGYSVKLMREQKPQLLERFKRDGYFLIDASEQPMPENANSTIKRSLMRQALPKLIQRVRQNLNDPSTPVILIGGVTYDVCADTLRDAGANVVHNAMINHPARGGQVRFREKLRAVLKHLPN